MYFLKDETGAVTVDWVVLTAALVGLGLASASVVTRGTQDLSEDVQGQLTRSDIVTATFTSISPVMALFNELNTAIDPGLEAEVIATVEGANKPREAILTNYEIAFEDLRSAINERDKEKVDRAVDTLHVLHQINEAEDYQLDEYFIDEARAQEVIAEYNKAFEKK